MTDLSFPRFAMLQADAPCRYRVYDEHEAAAEQRAKARAAFVALETDRVAQILRTDPLAPIPGNWSLGRDVPAAIELAAWVIEATDDPVPMLGIAMFDFNAREALIDRFAAAYAAAVADTKDFDGEWEAA